jgi:predicted nucleic acid-binding protein
MITLDTSALLALLDRGDPDHASCVDALTQEHRPYLIPAGILAEVGYLAPLKVGLAATAIFLEDIAESAYLLDCGERDIPRIIELMRRYEDLPLGLTDASVIACAERSGGRLLTLDRRDFAIVAGEGRIVLALDEPPAAQP